MLIFSAWVSSWAVVRWYGPSPPPRTAPWSRDVEPDHAGRQRLVDRRDEVQVGRDHAERLELVAGLPRLLAILLGLGAQQLLGERRVVSSWALTGWVNWSPRRSTKCSMSCSAASSSASAVVTGRLWVVGAAGGGARRAERPRRRRAGLGPVVVVGAAGAAGVAVSPSGRQAVRARPPRSAPRRHRSPRWRSRSTRSGGGGGRSEAAGAAATGRRTAVVKGWPPTGAGSAGRERVGAPRGGRRRPASAWSRRSSRPQRYRSPWPRSAGRR